MFVTNHSDNESRKQADASGGCGFISKPVLGKEILLVALTFILHGRLSKLDPTSKTVLRDATRSRKFRV